MNTSSEAIPSNLRTLGAWRFWLAIVATGAATGLGAAVLTKLLQVVQRAAWGGSGTNILKVAIATPPIKHVEILLLAGVLVGIGQMLLKRLSTGNGIDVTAAIWFHAGRLPLLRTLGSAVISVVIVGLGVSLGREGAPKQAGAVFANLFSDQGKLSDEQRRLLVACGAGAGMAAAYGVPLGGALFALEVLRGVLALRFVLPALVTSAIATGVSWIFLADAPTYQIPSFPSSPSALVFALIAGPIAGFCSVAYVRAVTKAERNRPEGWRRIVFPIVTLGVLGLISIWYPQLLGNGKDVSQQAFGGEMVLGLMTVILILKPAVMLACLGSGAPGGLFTPSLTFGAMLGGVLGYGWNYLWPGVPLGLFSLLMAGAILAATTQGPVSTVVLLMELTGHDRSFILPLLIAVISATLVARTIEPRSIYDARLTDEEIDERMRMRERQLQPMAS